MYDCNYSIIPTPDPESDRVCSSCHKKIEGLPSYPQLTQMFMCFYYDPDMSLHVGLEIGVPMCEACDEELTKSFKGTHSRYKMFAIILLVVFGLLSLGGESGGFVMIPILGAILFLFTKMDSFESNAKFQIAADKGFDIIRPVFDSLYAQGWKESIDHNKKDMQDCSEERFDQILHSVCKDGKYCILDNRSGYVVDLSDKEMLHKIYAGSQWKYTVPD